MFSEEYQTRIWKAGEIAPAGIYVRMDKPSYRTVILDAEGPLPATFDGHVALYRILPRNDTKYPEQQLMLGY